MGLEVEREGLKSLPKSQSWFLEIPDNWEDARSSLVLSHVGNSWGNSIHCTGRVTISTEPSSYEHRCVWWALGPAFQRVQAEVLTGRALGRCRVGMRETQGSNGVSGQEPRGFAFGW